MMTANLIIALKIAGLGLLGIFVSILLIMGVTALVARIPDEIRALAAEGIFLHYDSIRAAFEN